MVIKMALLKTDKKGVLGLGILPAVQERVESLRKNIENRLRKY